MTWTKSKTVLFWFLSFAVALVSWRFLLLGMETAFPNMIHQLQSLPTLFLLHVLAGPLALMIVPLQLWRKLRNNRPSLHRLMGRIYVAMVLVGGLSGLVIGFGANGGFMTKAGFVLLALFWLSTTSLAVYHVRNRNFIDHEIWMIRSAALTFAAVMLRIWLPVQLVAGIPFEIAYAVVAWACWVPNLIFAEIYLRHTKPAILA